MKTILNDAYNDTLSADIFENISQYYSIKMKSNKKLFNPAHITLIKRVHVMLYWKHEHCQELITL